MASLSLNGHIYTVTPLPTKIGLRTFVRVGKMMGPGLVRLASGGLDKKDLASPEFGALIGDVFDRLDNPELESTVETLMNSVECDGAPMAQRWMAEFSGKIATLTKVLMFAIQEHFGDFMNASASVQGSSGTAASKASK